MADDIGVTVTVQQLRFEIRFALMQIPPSMWRQWVLGKELKSDAAREMIIASIQTRLARFEIRQLPHTPSPLSGIGNKP